MIREAKQQSTQDSIRLLVLLVDTQKPIITAMNHRAGNTSGVRSGNQREDLSADEALNLNQHKANQIHIDGLGRQVITGLERPGIGQWIPCHDELLF